MGFTPVVRDRIRIIECRTTSGLALAVLSTSGIQHYAKIPERMAKAPAYARQFLHRLPSVWGDTKFLDGYPGKYVAIARRNGNLWYIAGNSAEAEPKTASLDLDCLATYAATLITEGDGGDLSFGK